MSILSVQCDIGFWCAFMCFWLIVFSLSSLLYCGFGRRILCSANPTSLLVLWMCWIVYRFFVLENDFFFIEKGRYKR